jgi:hypothetical protein
VTQEASGTDTSSPRAAGSAPSGRLRIARAERTASRTIDGRAVVISIDRNRVHVLNDVGTHVWELCDGRTLDAIVRDVVERFEVEPERAALDVRAFAEVLVRVGAATLSAAEE